MNRILFRLCFASIASLGFWPAPVSASEGQRNLATETRALFSAKCAGCHGPNLPKPKGRFGYVLDLARVAANRELIVPSFPDESGLWELVDRGEMPPDDSPGGPLSEGEKEVIREWIASGAPSDLHLVKEQVAFQAIQDSSAPLVEKSVWRLLGPLHLVAVHLPIALLIAAAGAVIAAALGWIHAESG